MKKFLILASVVHSAYAQLALSDPAQKSGEILGKISIPSIKLKKVIRKGADISIIDLGVAYWAGSGEPGKPGNMVLAGHRVTKTAPFRKIEKVEIDDLILITNKAGVITKYRVYQKFPVGPKEIWLVISPPDNPDESILTIFTCHPPRSDTERFMVRARLVQDLP